MRPEEPSVPAVEQPVQLDDPVVDPSRDYERDAQVYTDDAAAYTAAVEAYEQRAASKSSISPRVSIVVVNWNHPELITTLLKSLQMTEGLEYEVVVVDNGSEPMVVDKLRELQAAGLITTLVLEPVNHFFTQGNNIGVRMSNSSYEYILLLNSDIEILRPDWLEKITQWMGGVPEYAQSPLSLGDVIPPAGPRDIVSIGWSWDDAVTSCVRPEGWCVMFRRHVWRYMSPDFPMAYGLEEMIANRIRRGAVAGAAHFNTKYFLHVEQGSEAWRVQEEVSRLSLRQPAMADWYRGLTVQPLDFTIDGLSVDSPKNTVKGGPKGVPAPLYFIDW